MKSSLNTEQQPTDNKNDSEKNEHKDYLSELLELGLDDNDILQLIPHPTVH